MSKQLRTSVTLVAVLACSSIAARADVVLDWNAIAVSTLIGQGQSAFAQPRFMAITQLAVFEAVNAITGDYRPYLGTVVAPVGASADAAAVAAAYRVLKNYFPLAPNLDPAYAVSLALIPDGSAKSGGIATGEAAAALMIAIRLGDGAARRIRERDGRRRAWQPAPGPVPTWVCRRLRPWRSRSRPWSAARRRRR